jgi:flagellar secretion chaperone FliS
MHPKLNQYLEAEVMNADPVKLVTLLFRGALTAVASARAAFASGNVAERARQVSKAWAIVNELRQSLNHQTGGDISRQLSELYEYAGARLLAANAEQSEKALSDAAAVLTTLSEAWEGIHVQPQRAAEYRPAVEHQPLSIAC